MTAYGYYNWAKKNKKTKIKQWHPTKHLLCILLGSFLMFLMGFLLTIYTSSKLPIVDSFTTVFSIIATYMVAKRILEGGYIGLSLILYPFIYILTEISNLPPCYLQHILLLQYLDIFIG